MSSPKNTATTPARSWSVRGRLVGAAAIGFAVLVVIENAVFAATGPAPSYGAPIEDVRAYYAANRDAVAIVSGLVALYLPLLLVFVTGLHGLVERRGGAGADWSRLAVAAGLRRAPRVRRLARLAARDRRAPRPVVTEMTAAAPRSRTRARTPCRAARGWQPQPRSRPPVRMHAQTCRHSGGRTAPLEKGSDDHPSEHPEPAR